MQLFKPVLRNKSNFWITISIVMMNLLVWAGVLRAAPEPYIVDPIRDAEVAELLEYIRSGDRSGEAWEVTLTTLEAEQTITWYLQRYPQIPFAHPQLEITPDYVAGEGDATIAGLRVHVGGKARITLSDSGLPQVKILDLSLPVPGPIRRAIEREIQVQLQRADLLPVRFTAAEWYDDKVIVRGFIR